MNLTFENLCWSAEIYWSRPLLYDKARDFHYEANDISNIYKITGKYSKFNHKMLYIGKTYAQSVCIRLNQKDHIIRYENIREQYPRFKIYVSFGSIHLKYGKLTRKRIDEIESLLIYAHEFDDIQNKNKLFSLNVKDQYKIINKGYAYPLNKEIAYGIFTR